MANRYAVANGNWSSLATWDGGVSLPGAGDSVRPNGYTVTIDQDITVTELIGNASSPAVAGGSFLFQAGRIITGNVVMATGGGTLMSLTGSGSTRTIVGHVSSSVSGSGINVGSNPDGLIIVGNVTSTGNGNCIKGYDSLYLTITGNVSSTSTGRAIQDQTSAGEASISITGDVTSSGTAAAMWVNTAGTVTITGTVTGGTTYGLYSLQAVVIHNGNQIDGTTGHRAIYTPRLWISSSVQTQHQICTNNSGVVGALRSLYTGGVNLGQPSQANVRSGTTFGAASEYTGTLAVPSPTLVAIGVATDNTVGSYEPVGGASAADIADAVWDEARSGHTTTGTFGEKVNAELDSATQTQLDNIENTAAQRAFGIVERPPSDTGVITFVWPALGATITGTVSLNNASYIPVIGAFEFLRTDGGKYFYTLAYNTADRPVSAGSARYALTDGTYTRYLVLRVVESGDTGETTALAVLCFDWEAVTGEVPSRSVLNALRHIRNKWALDGNTKTVYAEDDTTPAYTTSVTADGAGNIIADTPD